MTTDVCIIGSGFAGAIVASELGRHGIRVLLLEAGAAEFPHPNRDTFTSSGPVPYDLNDTRVRAAGGTSTRWSGNCPRLHPSDFRLRSLYDRDVDWPIAYDDLEPYYVRAERALGVHGARDNPFAGPWSADLPMPPPARYRLGEVRRWFRERGVRVGAMPRAITTTPYGERPVNSMYRVADVHLADALATGRVTLLTDAVARRIELDASGRAARIIFEGLDRPAETVEARLVVLAAGAVENARLLLLSAAPACPDGLANSSGWVGRGFMEHPLTIATWLTASRELPSSYCAHSYDWYDHGRRADSLSILVELWAQYQPESVAAITAAPTARGDALRRQIAAEAARQLSVMALVEERPGRSAVTLDTQRTDVFGDAVPCLHYAPPDETRDAVREALAISRRLVELTGGGQLLEERVDVAAHHLGTCRMGHDPRDSVVDRDLRSHDVPNLYIAGSAAFPSGAAVNPTLTIVALAYRLAEHLTMPVPAS